MFKNVMAIRLGPVVQSLIKLILVSINLNCCVFTAKGGLATILWPNEVMNYKFIFLKP